MFPVRATKLDPDRRYRRVENEACKLGNLKEELTAMALHAKNDIRDEIFDDVYGSADISQPEHALAVRLVAGAGKRRFVRRQIFLA